MSGATRYPDSKNKNSITDGLEFQDWVTDLLSRHGIIIQNYCSRKYQFTRGENRQGFEIKLDRRCTETGRLSIETYEKTEVNAQWVQSGILREDGSIFYVQGNCECVWIFLKKFLQKLYWANNGDDKPRYERKEEATIKAFYLPIEDADKYGHRIEPEQF